MRAGKAARDALIRSTRKVIAMRYQPALVDTFLMNATKTRPPAHDGIHPRHLSTMFQSRPTANVPGNSCIPRIWTSYLFESTTSAS